MSHRPVDMHELYAGYAREEKGGEESGSFSEARRMTLRQSLRQSSLSKPQEAEEEGLQEREAGPGRGGGQTRRPRGARKGGLDAVALCMGAKRHLLRFPAHLPVRESCEVCPIHLKPQTDDYGNVECLHTGVFSSGTDVYRQNTFKCILQRGDCGPPEASEL